MPIEGLPRKDFRVVALPEHAPHQTGHVAYDEVASRAHRKTLCAEKPDLVELTETPQSGVI